MEEDRKEVEVEQTETITEEQPTRDDGELTRTLREIVGKLDALIANTNRPAATPMPAKLDRVEEQASIYDM